jgi:RNA 2',3'-cyclic 3'-phosphodiesterase
VRAFIAIDLPEPLRAALARAQHALARTGAAVRWVRPEQLHVTLKFLGEIPAPAVDALRGALREAVAGHAAFDLEVTGLGAFPVRRPKAVWAGCCGALDRLAALQRAIDRAAQAAGVPVDAREFRPHITLGRVKTPAGVRELSAAVAACADAAFGRLPVHAVVLYRSELLPDGPRYEAIEVFACGPGARPDPRTRE